MEKYIEMLQEIKDSVHIERLLNESPSWIGIAFSIAITILGVGFALMLTTQILGSRTNSGLVLEGVSIVTSFIGVLATTVLFLYGLYTMNQAEHLTQSSELEVVTYVSQLSSDEYNELKQQVELNRDSELEDNDLKAINNSLIKKMLPRRNSIIFFRTGAIVNE
jgi:hypothetical protein